MYIHCWKDRVKLGWKFPFHILHVKQNWEYV